MILERRLLQCVIAIAGLVPVAAGLAGVVRGGGMLGVGPDVSADSHIRYLSGLLLAIGLAFWAMVPAVERHAASFRLLGLVVVTGGCARLASLALDGWPDLPMRFALAMELVVTPAICLWQAGFARRAGF